MADQCQFGRVGLKLAACFWFFSSLSSLLQPVVLAEPDAALERSIYERQSISLFAKIREKRWLERKNRRYVRKQGRGDFRYNNATEEYDDWHVYLRVVSDGDKYLRRRYPNKTIPYPVTLPNNDVMKRNGEMKISGRDIPHGWVESSDHRKTKNSPFLYLSNIKINVAGLYLVYAQVVFRYDNSQHSTYALVKFREDRHRDAIVLAQCEGTSIILPGTANDYQSSCYTQTVVYLEKSSKIRVECDYGYHSCAKILTRPKKTFFGVVRISGQ